LQPALTISIESDLQIIQKQLFATADAPGASGDRAQHDLRDHDAADADVLFFLR
jgi:hypothetical protein